MGKRAYLDLKESVSDLKAIVLKQKTLKGKQRAKSLLFIKMEKFDTRQALADNLSVHIRTLESWLKDCRDGSIDQMLNDKPKIKKSKIIIAEIHKGLSQRVHDPNNLFLGYCDAQNWVKQQYGVDVKYQRI